MISWLKNNLQLAGIGFAAILLIIVILQISSCKDRGREAAQAKQNAASGAAFSDAVENGLATIDNRVVTDAAIATATAQVKDEIGNAQSLDAIDGAITASLCGSTRHRDDPACRVP